MFQYFILSSGKYTYFNIVFQYGQFSLHQFSKPDAIHGRTQKEGSAGFLADPDCCSSLWVLSHSMKSKC